MEATARPPIPRTRPPPPAPPPRVRAASAGDEGPGVSPSPLPATTSSSGPSPFAASSNATGRPSVPPRVPPRAGYGTGGRSGSVGAAVLADPGVPFVPSPSLTEATTPRAPAAAALSQPSLPPHILPSSAPPPLMAAVVPHEVPVQSDGGAAPLPSSASPSAPATVVRAGPSVSPGRVGPADSRIPVPPRPQLSRASPVSRSSPVLPTTTTTSPVRPSAPSHHHPAAATAPPALAAADPASTMSAPLLRTPVLFPQTTAPADSSSSSSSPPPSSSSSSAATVSFAAIGRGAPPPVPFKTRAQVPPRPAVVPRHAPGVLPPATDTDNNGSGHAGDAEEKAEPWPSTTATTATAAATNIYGSVIERPVTHHQRPALVSSLSAAPGVGRGAMAASPPGTATGTTAAVRGRLPPPIPPASAKPTLKPRPGHRRSRSYDPATLRKTLVRPFDPIQMQAKTMEDQPRSMGELRRAAVQVGSDDDSSDGDGVDSGFSLGGGGGLGMMSMCLGAHPSVRVRAKTGGTSSTLKPSRDLRSSDKADRKAAKNNNNKEKKKDKERKGFWKKNKKEAKDAGAVAAGKGERALSAEESRINADAYHRWFQVLGREDLVMARVLSGVVKRGDRDQATTAFVYYFTGRGVMLALFGHLIRAEVDDTAEPGTLLRSNNMLSALLSKHLQLVGRSYLRRVLHPIVAQVCEIATETNFEVNPTRLEESEGPPGVVVDLAQNTQNVLFVAAQVLHALRTSIHYCPMSIREVCQELAHVVSAKYPDAITSVVGGYFFLRFLCPALLAPEGFALVDDGILTQPAKRALVLVSKVLQQLANGLSFGMKETYMIPFNPFLAENEAPVRDYLRLLSTIGADEVQRGDEDTLDGSESDTRHCLGKLAYDNRDDISRALASGEGLGASPELGHVRDEWKRIAADLLGPPPLPSSAPAPPL